MHDVHPAITEDLIRKDLDHIHNLIVISVTFKNDHVYIATNSVHNALFARSCMMSRRTYKGLKIGFNPDECARPLATIPMSKTMPKKSIHPSPNKPNSRPNRFHVLSFDGSEGEAEEEVEDEEETDEYESISNELNSFSSRNGGVETDGSNWTWSP